MDLPNTALFMRTLRMDNRHWQNYLFRFLILFIIGILLIQYLFSSLMSTQMSAPGLEFFRHISYLNLFFITILSFSLFASAITEEKEVDSLNLLLMTGLTSFTMLISKSTSKLIIALMLIMAQVPFSILSVTLGGISMHQVISVYISLFTYTFLVCNIALLFSVICSRTFKAACFTFFSLMCFHLSTIFFPVMARFSPFAQTSKILSTGFKDLAWSEQALSNLGAGIILFIVSLLIFDRFSRNHSSSGPMRINNKWRIFPIPRAWNNAVAWKEFFFSTGGTWGFLIVSLLLSLLIGGIISFVWLNQGLTETVIGNICFWSGISFLIAKTIYMSATIFNREINDKTYSTLITLPISVGKIAYSKIFGGSLFLCPSMIAIAVGIVFMTNFFNDLQMNFELIGILSLIISAIIQYVFYLYLVTFFSLLVKHVGFIIALIVFWFVSIAVGIPGLMISMISFIPFGILGDFSGEIILVINSAISIFLYVFAIIFTNRLIVKKLEKLAAA